MMKGTIGVRGRFGAMLSLIAAAVVVAGCGSSSSSANSSGKSSGKPSTQSAAVRSDIARYQMLLGPAPRFVAGNGSLAVAALKRKPSSHTVLGLISCAIPTCTPYTQGAEAAAKELGWQIDTVNTQFTPTAWRSAFETLIQKKANVIMSPGIAPTAEVLPEMKQAKAEGAVVVTYGITDTSAGGSSPISYQVTGKSTFAQMGMAQAYTAVGLEKGPPSVVILTDPTIPAFAPQANEIKEIIGAAGGSVQVLDVSSANIGSSVPGQLVSFLQAHPTVKYVLPSDGDFMAGVPQALKSAGLSNIKVIGASSGTESMPLVKNGQMAANVTTVTVADGWRLMYEAAQILDGNPPSDRNPLDPVAVADKANAEQFGNVGLWPQSLIAAYQRAMK